MKEDVHIPEEECEGGHSASLTLFLKISFIAFFDEMKNISTNCVQYDNIPGLHVASH